MPSDDEKKYRKRGEALFDMFCHLHMIARDSVEQLDVQAILQSPDRNQALDGIMASLVKFTVSTLLVPFRQKDGNVDGIGPDELAAVRALLTEKQLLMALGERSGEYEANGNSQSGSKPTTGMAQKGKGNSRRVKRELAFTTTFAGISLSGGVIGALVGFGVGIFVLIGAIFWCNG